MGRLAPDFSHLKPVQHSRTQVQLGKVVVAFVCVRVRAISSLVGVLADGGLLEKAVAHHLLAQHAMIGLHRAQARDVSVQLGLSVRMRANE